MSPEQVLFAFLCCWLCLYRLSEHKFFVYKGQPIFSGDHEKNIVEVFGAGILRV